MWRLYCQNLIECVLLVDHGLVHQSFNPETVFRLLCLVSLGCDEKAKGP